MSLGAGHPGTDRIEGIVLRRSSKDVLVDVPSGAIVCDLRGKMRFGEPCVAGDRVLVSWTGPGTGAIEETLPRRSELRRGDAAAGKLGRVIAANLDRLVAVTSAHPFPPRWALVDRLLVEGARQGLTPVVVVNKIDLAPAGSPQRPELEEAAGIYRSAGIPVLLTSAIDGTGLRDLEEALREHRSVLTGHSGVGKTTILNRLVPDLSLPTREVNPVTGKGRHATTTALLIRLPGGGHIADTPGFREWALVGLEPEDLGRYYPEFLETIASCRFKDCLHREEPWCALKERVGSGGVSKLRYQNYLQILGTLVEKDGKKPYRKFRRKTPPETS